MHHHVSLQIQWSVPDVKNTIKEQQEKTAVADYSLVLLGLKHCSQELWAVLPPLPGLISTQLWTAAHARLWKARDSKRMDKRFKGRFADMNYIQGNHCPLDGAPITAKAAPSCIQVSQTVRLSLLSLTFHAAPFVTLSLYLKARSFLQEMNRVAATNTRGINNGLGHRCWQWGSRGPFCKSQGLPQFPWPKFLPILCSTLCFWALLPTTPEVAAFLWALCKLLWHLWGWQRQIYLSKPKVCKTNTEVFCTHSQPMKRTSANVSLELLKYIPHLILIFASFVISLMFYYYIIWSGSHK